MTGMNVWKRATLAIVRKPVRSGIIGLLMLMVFTSLVAQVGVSTALQKMSDDIGAPTGFAATCAASVCWYASPYRDRKSTRLNSSH